MIFTGTVLFKPTALLLTASPRLGCPNSMKVKGCGMTALRSTPTLESSRVPGTQLRPCVYPSLTEARATTTSSCPSHLLCSIPIVVIWGFRQFAVRIAPTFPANVSTTTPGRRISRAVDSRCDKIWFFFPRCLGESWLTTWGKKKKNSSDALLRAQCSPRRDRSHPWLTRFFLF